MKVIIIHKLTELSKYRKICIGWFFYHFLMVCLVIINLLFFIFNFTDLKFTPTDTSSLLLTFVGFLFAFAGINIYSIFNTNLEAEKYSLQNLRDDYERKLENTLNTIEFSKSLVKIQVLTQLIVDSPIADFQLQDNIESSIRLFHEAKDYIRSQQDNNSYEIDSNPASELRVLASGVKSQLGLLQGRIRDNRLTYYSNFPDEESIQSADTKLQTLYDLMIAFEDGTIYEDTSDEAEETEEMEIPSFMERVKTALNAVKKIFKP